MELTQLFVHPLKSCHGIAVPQAEATLQGLVDDRVWLLVRPDGSQITARTHYQLVLVEAERLSAGQWQFCAPDMAPLLTSSLQYTQEHRAQVWKSEFQALAGDDAAKVQLSAQRTDSADSPPSLKGPPIVDTDRCALVFHFDADKPL